MMGFWYAVLAIFLAVTLNHGNRFMRGLGTLVAALSLVMMVSSIILADFDGTFAQAGGRLKPLILNSQAGLATAGLVFLLWAAWAQLVRRVVLPLPLLNHEAGFGRVSRYAHWMTATLMLALIPMGIFMSALPGNAPDHAAFAAAHETMGELVLILAVLRLAWLLRSPPASSPGRLAVAAHAVLYALMLAFPVTGLLQMMCRGEPVVFFGWAVPALCEPDLALAGGLAVLHDWLLPLAFYLVFSAHVGAVLKHHFVDRRRGDVRRMVR
jgi:cytochrome b561